MFNIHDWILLIQRGLNLLEGFVCLESVPCSSWDELQNERMQKNACFDAWHAYCHLIFFPLLLCLLLCKHVNSHELL